VLAAQAPAVLTLIVVNVVVFAAQQLLGNAFTQRLVSYPPAIASGQWYRLLTPMFLHAGILHIGLNMLALYYLGPPIERVFGSVRFVVMYLVTGFLASVASYVLGPPGVPSLGASGAIFGVFGVLLVYVFNRRSNPAATQLLRSLLFLLGLNVLLGVIVPAIDIYAHAGGFVAGLLMGLGFDQGPKRLTSAAVPVLTTVVLVAVGIAAVILRTQALHSAASLLR
jgi:membrane associated rhomboid family serine protease